MKERSIEICFSFYADIFSAFGLREQLSAGQTSAVCQLGIKFG